ncbi:hypothetical protein GCM10027284_02230 [Cyclobacterium sediminis]
MNKKIFQVLKNMGIKYLIFRFFFEFKKKSGLLKRKFPVAPKLLHYYNLNNWKSNLPPFFFENIDFYKFKGDIQNIEFIISEYKKISSYRYKYFSNIEYDLGPNYDWVTNPDTKFQYSNLTHWVDINDFSKDAGDIKYIWEPSRFSHIYTIIRYDLHCDKDCSKQVFDEISNWIDNNKINAGPNFKCSQEISLRVLNWVFALYYYKDSNNLTPELFSKIQHYIFWQIKHVYDNINFSRIAVRNNHAITETLTLYIIGTLFPNFPGATKWKYYGKKWFEEEISFQIHDDGTYLQFSMNYHRVVVQLLTWGIKLAELNGDKFKEVVYVKAKKSLQFLINLMDVNTGWLPNYGPNDGALFFKLSDSHFRDFRPQLEALSYALHLQWPFKKFSDALWYGLDQNEITDRICNENGLLKYNSGGFYLFKNKNSFSLIRCGDHRTRPTQADNLHLDIWYQGKNLLHDGGSFKYNTSEKNVKYFRGTESHNTVMLGDLDQMERGPRFIWYHWTQCDFANVNEYDEYYLFEGQIKAFQYVSKNIRHKRKIKFYKYLPIWEIEDEILGKPEDLILRQIWHTNFLNELNFSSRSNHNNTLNPSYKEGFYSELYGSKSSCDQIEFSTYENKVITTIEIKL